MADIERRAKLTDRTVRAAQPEARRYILWDVDKKGFGLRVEPSGHKSFIVRYRANGGGRNAPRRQMRLKAAPGEVLTADGARRLANRILADVAHGKDPQTELSDKRKEMTVLRLCQLYLTEGVGAKKQSTIETDKGRVTRHILPLLGNKLISEVTGADVERFLRDVAAGRTKADVKTGKRGRAIVEGGKGTATRTVGLLGGIFSFAVRRKLVSANPVQGVKRYADRQGERFLSGNELSVLGETLREFESNGANATAIAIIRLLTFTGARKSEIARLTWSEVDFDRACLRLADSKTGAKVIPLGPPALAILSGLKRSSGGEFVFPAEVPGRPFQGTEKVWRKVRAAAELRDVRLHDLRHSFASVALLAGDSLSLIGKLLGHKDVKTTARYAHLADDPLRAASDRISSAIARSMEPQLGAADKENIVSLRRS